MLLTLIVSEISFASSEIFENLKLNSIRLRLEKPATFHTLIYQTDAPPQQTIDFELEPLNNERLGVFVDFNNFLIGYAADVFKNKKETKTTDIIFSTEVFKNFKISLNYQKLEGFNTKAKSSINKNIDSLFIESTTSTKLEVFGIHHLISLKKESLFNHFFLNKPKTNKRFFYDLSLIGSWSVKRLKLENPSSLIYQPSFLFSNPAAVNKINAYSADTSIGTLASIGFPQNINYFAGVLIGGGFFKNFNNRSQFKKTGLEFIVSYGSGLSWTSQNKKFLLSVEAWYKSGKHVNTLFGDLSLIYFL